MSHRAHSEGPYTHTIDVAKLFVWNYKENDFFDSYLDK